MIAHSEVAEETVETQTLTILQARELLKKNEEDNLGLDIRIAESHQAPGGGKMIVYNSPLTPRALQFISHRKRNGAANINVIVYKPGQNGNLRVPAPEEIDSQSGVAERAREVTRKVVEDASAVAGKAREIYDTISGPLFGYEHLEKPETQQALGVFEKALRQFCASTETVVQEYVDNGNTLIMDLITQYELDLSSLKHALKVACFATELAAMMGIDDYLDETQPDEIFGRLDEPFPDPLSDDLLDLKKQDLFKKELVEIFIGGFMHDAGLWQTRLKDGHEVRGAMVVARTPEIEDISRSLVDIVLFHSDVQQLAENQGVVRVFELPDGGEKMAFQRDYYKTAEDARNAVALRTGKFYHKILTGTDLRKILPVAIAESYITQTQSRTPVPRQEVISELVSCCEGGLYQKFMIAMCNAQADVMAPSRVLVTLEGRISIHSTDRPCWFDVTDYVAVSAGHDDSRYAPHLITIFAKDEDGSVNKLIPLSPQASQLWDRSDPESRMYIAAGKFRSLSFKVTDILRKDIYEKHFKAFESEVQRRMQADLIY